MVDQRLNVFPQLFSWTSVGLLKSPIDKMIALQDHLNLWAVPRAPSVPAKNSFTEIFSKWKNVWSEYCRKFHSPLSKISLHYQSAIYHWLTVFHQLFSWTSAELSKWAIDKMIGSQGHLNVWAVPGEQYDIIQKLLQSKSFEMDQFPNQP